MTPERKLSTEVSSQQIEKPKALSDSLHAVLQQEFYQGMLAVLDADKQLDDIIWADQKVRALASKNPEFSEFVEQFDAKMSPVEKLKEWEAQQKIGELIAAFPNLQAVYQRITQGITALENGTPMRYLKQLEAAKQVAEFLTEHPELKWLLTEDGYGKGSPFIHPDALPVKVLDLLKKELAASEEIDRLIEKAPHLKKVSPDIKRPSFRLAKLEAEINPNKNDRLTSRGIILGGLTASVGVAAVALSGGGGPSEPRRII